MEKNEMIEQIVARVAEKLAQAGETVSGIKEVSDPSLPGLLILTQDHGTECHKLLESERIRKQYNTCCALLQEDQVDLDGIDTVVLFNLTIDAMCKIVSGIVDTPYTKIVAKALLLGKKLYVPKEEVELYSYPVSSLGSYQCMLQAKLTKLVYWGLKICPLNQIEDCILGKTSVCMEEDNLNQADNTEKEKMKDCCDVSDEKSEGIEHKTEPVREEKEITISRRVITERDIIEANRDNVKVIHLTERNIVTALARDAASARNIRLVRE